MIPLRRDTWNRQTRPVEVVRVGEEGSVESLLTGVRDDEGAAGGRRGWLQSDVSVIGATALRTSCDCDGTSCYMYFVTKTYVLNK